MTKERNDPDMESPSGRSGGGESGGGAYPNPHRGKKPDNGGYMGHGGQTEQPYHGGGQLGERDVGNSENVNSTTRKTGIDEKDSND